MYQVGSAGCCYSINQHMPASPPRRWRKLEGSDPSTYEMIQKIQTLQKRLISKTEEAVEKDLLIQVKKCCANGMQAESVA